MLAYSVRCGIRRDVGFLACYVCVCVCITTISHMAETADPRPYTRAQGSGDAGPKPWRRERSHQPPLARCQTKTLCFRNVIDLAEDRFRVPHPDRQVFDSFHTGPTLRDYLLVRN